MFPQAPGTGRSSQNSIQHLSSGLEPTSVQGIPVIPSSVMMSTAGPSSGYVMHQGFTGSVNMTPVPSGSLNMQPNQNKMWQQPHQNSFKPQDLHNQQLNEKSQQPKDYKHRDYLKQQQRLKAMPLSFSKGMSADTLIGNLLDKKDTFTPKPGAVGKQTADRAEAGGHMSQVRLLGPTVNDGASGVMGPQDNLPGWLSPSSSRLPPIYSHIWSLVADPASGGMLVDTNKILALLLTSGLPKEVLGFIWNLATNGANIQLNQQQLYIALALVALAQMGCTFNNLSVLNFIPTPPIPTFNMNVPKSAPDDKSKKSESTVKAPPPTTVSSFPLPSSAIGAMGPAFTVPLQEVASPVHRPILTEDYDFADDFTDFQSADTNSIQPSNVCSDFLTTAVIQPSLTAKQVVNELNHSVVTKLGRSHGRSIGSRLANHTLGAPKPHYNTKLRRPSVDNDNVYIQDDFSSNTERNFTYVRDQKGDSKYPDNSENEDFSDFQVAAGLNVNVDELFPKCHPKTKSQDFMLKESAIRNESDNEEVGKNKEDELPSLDSPTSSKHTAMEIKGPPTQLSLPVITPPPTNPTRELMSIEEDRYSALRFVELENTRSSASATSIEPSKNAEADDFGDFVSADDLFAEIAVRNTGNSTSQCNTLSNNPVQTSSIQNVEFPVDDWGIQDVFQSSQDSQQPALFDSKTSSETKRLDILSTDFSDLSISKEINDPLAKMNTSSKWNFDFSIGKESLNLNSNCSENASEKDDEFGDFIGTDLTQIEEANSKTPSSFLGDQLWTDSNSSKVVPGVLSDNRSVSSLELPGVTLSRHGSLPSLDLNLFPGNDDIIDKSWNSQVLDWLRCIENSCSLLQAAARTFTNISSHSVLMEVLGTAEGRNYLSNLLEVHRVTWRIQRSYQRSGHESNQVDTVLSSIQKVWSTLQTFYKLANIETAVEKDGSDEESGQPACGVCGSPASRGVLEYGGHVYHAPCANLWLNCVDRTLPAHSPLL